MLKTHFDFFDKNFNSSNPKAEYLKAVFFVSKDILRSEIVQNELTGIWEEVLIEKLDNQKIEELEEYMFEFSKKVY